MYEKHLKPLESVSREVSLRDESLDIPMMRLGGVVWPEKQTLSNIEMDIAQTRGAYFCISSVEMFVSCFMGGQERKMRWAREGVGREQQAQFGASAKATQNGSNWNTWSAITMGITISLRGS